MIDSERPRSDQPEEMIRVGDQFYVLAVSSRADERARVLKHDETFAVLDRRGDILGDRLGDHGLYHEGTRHLSWLDLTVDGLRPLVLSSGLDRVNAVLAVDLTNPDLSRDGSISVPRGVVHFERTCLVWSGVLHHRLRLHNFGLGPVSLRIGLRFAADFADMFEVRGVVRAQRGRMRPPEVIDGRVVLAYDGLDGVRRTTAVACDPAPASLGPDRLDLEVALEGGQTKSFEVRFACSGELPPVVLPHREAVRAARGRAEGLMGRGCEVRTSSPRFDEWLERSRADLSMMVSDTEHGQYPFAGVPWFSAPFGRDGLITALQTLWVDPDLARGVLSFLSATQADATDEKQDAQPGKIVHEVRRGEMARTGEVPYGRYYGSVDATPLFVLLAGEYLRATGDRAFLEGLWPSVRKALEWLDGDGDPDRDGFVEYRGSRHGGLTNQGWKDSRDSVFHENAALAGGPIALCEVQAYTFAAKQDAAVMADELGDSAMGSRLRHEAAELRRRFEEKFWDEGLGTYVLALDGEKRPCRVASSNAGHALFAGIASPERAGAVTRDLLSPRFFSGWGVRTVAQDQARFNPMSYHNGSIWPHDTAMAATGMARYGHAGAAGLLLRSMMEVALEMDQHRLPELFCGFERREGEGPIRYPVACSPQAWASGSVFQMLRACLGLHVEAGRGEVVFRNPSLPEFLRFVELRGLRVGKESLDLSLERRDGNVSVQVQRRAPGVRVVVMG